MCGTCACRRSCEVCAHRCVVRGCICIGVWCLCVHMYTCAQVCGTCVHAGVWCRCTVCGGGRGAGGEARAQHTGIPSQALQPHWGSGDVSRGALLPFKAAPHLESFSLSLSHAHSHTHAHTTPAHEHVHRPPPVTQAPETSWHQRGARGARGFRVHLAPRGQRPWPPRDSRPGGHRRAESRGPGS